MKILDWISYWFFCALGILLLLPPPIVPIAVILSYAAVFAAGYAIGTTHNHNPRS